MTTTISGSTGVDKVASGAIEHGDLPSGSVLQVVQVADNSFSILGSSSHTLMSQSITPLATNSSFVLICTVTHGITETGNNDAYDFGLQFTREYSGSAAASIGGNTGATRRQVYSGGTLYTTDVPLHTADTTYGAKYETFTRTFNHKDSPSVAAGTSITYKLMVNVETSYYRNRSLQGSTSGGQSSLMIMEIAP